MNDKLIMEIYVQISTQDISMLDGPIGSVIMIPFGGKVTGDLFSGVVRPGGVDTQTVDANGVRHMSARYILEGHDHTGATCRIYVENNGHFPKDAPMPFKTIPAFFTDSRALAPRLHSRQFRGEGHPADGGVLIKFFEIGAE